MDGSGYGRAMSGMFFNLGCLVFLAGAGVGIGLWVLVPKICHWFASHWH